MKTTGNASWRYANASCRSKPSAPGMRTSSSTQPGADGYAARNPRALAWQRTANPSASNIRRKVSRTDASSSTTWTKPSSITIALTPFSKSASPFIALSPCRFVPEVTTVPNYARLGGNSYWETSPNSLRFSPMHVFAALHGRKSATMLGSLTSTGVRMPHRILVVDAHPLNRLVVAEQLTTLGHAPLCVDDAEQALALLDASRFDLVVTACRMPGIDGFSLAVRINDLAIARGVEACPIVGYSND